MTSRSDIPETEIEVKMATMDGSPSLFSGQQWTDWADAVITDSEIEKEESDVEEDSTATDSMKLKIEDMPLFGHCPSRDEFYLVVCDRCNQVIKPQALQTHLDVRHGGKGSYSTYASSKGHQSSSSGHSSSSKCHSKSHSPSKSHSRSSHSKSHYSPNKSHRSYIPPMSPLKPINKDLVNSGLDSASVVTLTDGKSNLQTKASVKEPPHSLTAVTKVGADLDMDKVNDSKSNISSNNPVVKVERMSASVSMKKRSRDERKSLTNGSLQDSKSPPPLSMPVITDIEDIKDINISDKRSDSPIPHLTAAHDNGDAYMEEMDTVPVSEIDSAVSSILEPLSPVPEPEPGGFVALVTSSATITTNTVTMASITTSATSVTNVITTMSSFRFGSMGRPNIPMGSIRVNFSSSGVLNTIASDGHAVTNANVSNNNNASTLKSSSSGDTNISRSSICSNGNMESTISDIVQSAVNSGITGGFQSLSPLTSSPPKSSSSLTNKLNSSFKSPSKVSPLVKSTSSSGVTKSGSKLSQGSVAVFKANSGGNVNSNASGSAGSGGPVNTDAIKKFQLLNKPDKIIPLKDREYDPNKHCGVIVSETGKPCTRSLTCKSHALSLRRAVIGRRLPFDELLQEHRDAKEAYMKAKLESREATAALKAAQAASKTPQSQTIVSSLGKVHYLTTGTTSVAKPNAHLHQSLSKDGKSLSVPVFAVNKPATVQRPASISSHRTSFSSIGSPSSQEDLQSPTGKPAEKLGTEEEEDNAYTTYHPRPIAACSFGARYHNNYGNGFGCHTFGRRTDHVRAVFLDMLEKHANPPPPKKLCVEADLPHDGELTNNDPYDFLDSGRNHLGQQHIIQGPGLITSAAPNKVVAKPKTKVGGLVSGVIPGNKTLKDAITFATKAAVCATVTPNLFTASSSAKKRRGSGCGTLGVTSSVGATLVTAAPSILANVGAISQTSGANQHQFAIAIPSVNISGAALSQLGASLVASGNLKHAKNNVIKDMGFYVTGIPQEALLNGQIVNITNSQLTTTDISANQMQPVSQDDGNKTPQQVNVITNSKHLPHQSKFVNSITNLDAIRALQAGKSSLITNLPPNAVLLDGNLQPGTMFQHVTFTTSTVTPVMSLGNAVLTQSSTASLSSTQSRSGTNSPLATTSPVPNGIISNQSDKELHLSQRHPVFQSKTVSQPVLQQTTRGTIQHASNIFTGAQLHSQNLTFHAAPNSATLTNQISSNPNSVLTGHQVQMKNNLQKSNKLQPMSITIPLVTQTNIGNSGLDIGHQQTHALFITGDDTQKQGLHLQQTDLQTHNSPTHSVIS